MNLLLMTVSMCRGLPHVSLILFTIQISAFRLLSLATGRSEIKNNAEPSGEKHGEEREQKRSSLEDLPELECRKECNRGRERGNAVTQPRGPSPLGRGLDREMVRKQAFGSLDPRTGDFQHAGL